jgi:hypothetical protein
MELTDDDLPPSDPAESLRLIQQERAAAERDLTPGPRLFTWPWGTAWVIGFALLFLRFGPDDRVLVDMPSLIVAIVGGGGMLLAGFLGWQRWRR